MRYLLAIVVAFLAFTGTALAAAGATAAASEVVPPDASVFELVAPVLDALKSGSPALALALALVLAVGLARKYGSKRFPFLATDAGGTALTFLGSLGAACAAALAGGALPSLSLLWTALVVAAGASGGYTAVRRLVAPALRFLESKLPAGLRPFVAPVFNFVLYFFENRGAKKIAKAEAAGEAAVEAKPAEGAAGVVKVGKSFP